MIRVRSEPKRDLNCFVSLEDIIRLSGDEYAAEGPIEKKTYDQKINEIVIMNYMFY